MLLVFEAMYLVGAAALHVLHHFHNPVNKSPLSVACTLFFNNKMKNMSPVSWKG